MDYVPCVTHRLGINKSAKLHKGLQLRDDEDVIDQRPGEGGMRQDRSTGCMIVIHFVLFLVPSGKTGRLEAAVLFCPVLPLPAAAWV